MLSRSSTLVAIARPHRKGTAAIRCLSRGKRERTIGVAKQRSAGFRPQEVGNPRVAPEILCASRRSPARVPR